MGRRRTLSGSGRRMKPRWWKVLRQDPGFWISLVFLVILMLVIMIGPFLSPFSESEQDLSRTLSQPDSAHWFGTDELGRDLLTRVLYGGRISLAVGILGALTSLVIGVGVGGLAGLLGGWRERAFMRMFDVLDAVPFLLVVIALMVVFDFGGFMNILVSLALVFWITMARVVRSRVAELRKAPFVDAGRSLGAGLPRLFLVHILPNSFNVIIVTATFMVPLAIFVESFLSFLGLGITLPHASWGTLADDGLSAIQSHPHVLIFPAGAICLTLFLFQTLGEALRNALDPRQGEEV
jgi:oligopeptide transport system permease protein